MLSCPANGTVGQSLPSDNRSANDRSRAVSGSPWRSDALPLSADNGHWRNRDRTDRFDPQRPRSPTAALDRSMT